MRRAADAILAAAVLGLAVLVVMSAIGQRRDDAGAPGGPGRLQGDPLDVAALRDLGLRLDREGRSAEADTVLTFAGRRSWRDGPTQVWLLRRRLEQARFDDAFRSADALLRRDADETSRPVLFPILIAAARYEQTRPALEARLAQGPWWRGDFLRDLAARGDPDGTLQVLAALAQGATPPIPDEYAPLVNRLVSAGRYPDALAAWRQVARRPGPAELLRDGDLAGPSDHTAFTWSAADGAGGASDVRPSPDGSPGRALRIDYDGFSSPILPAQLLVLPPGRYRLTWREQGGGSVSGHLYWRVRCADSGQVLAKAADFAPVLADPSPWRTENLTFDTPPTGCAGQWLELTTNPGERRESLTARYAGFRLGREG